MSNKLMKKFYKREWEDWEALKDLDKMDLYWVIWKARSNTLISLLIGILIGILIGWVII